MDNYKSLHIFDNTMTTEGWEFVNDDISIIYSKVTQIRPNTSNCENFAAMTTSTENTNTGNLRKRSSTDLLDENATKPKNVKLAENNTSKDIKENTKINNNSLNSTNDRNLSSGSRKTSKKSIIVQLANLLAKHINNNTTLILTGLFKFYHIALIQEKVINVEWTSKPGYNKYYGVFHPDFVKGCGLSNSAKRLKYLLEKSLNQGSDLKTIKLKISSNFGKKFEFHENPSIKELDKLVAELVSCSCASLRDDQSPKQIRNTPSLREDIQKLAVHVLKVKNNCVVFTEDFLNEEKELAGNLNLLRQLLIDKLKTENDKTPFKLKDLSNCQFKISNFADSESPDVKMALPDNDFIKDCSNVTIEVKNIKNKISNKDVKRISNIYDNKININFPEIRITFNREALSAIAQCLANVCCKRVNFINTNSIEFCIQKVQQIIQDIPQYSKINGCLIINFNYFRYDSCSILEAFETTTHLLLIEHNKFSEEIEGMDKICWKLEDIVQRSSERNPKNVVVIGDTKKLHPLFKFKCNTVDDEYLNIVSQLTEESQSHLLQTKKIKLYDRELILAQLMDKHVFQSLVKSPKLLMQILNDSITVCSKQHQRQRSLYKFKLKQDENLFNNKKIVVISGRSGSGKTIYLHELEDKLLKSSMQSSLPMWIVGIDLKKDNVTKKLKGRTFEESEEAIDFLNEVLNYEGFQKHLFAACAAGKLSIKLILFFYGFEEKLIHPSNNFKKSILTLLKALQLANGIGNIYAACNTQSRSELEQKLDALICDLEDFTHRRKLEFMVASLPSHSYNSKDKLLERADQLLKCYKSKTLINTPLKLEMIVHLHKSQLLSDESNPTYDIQSNICDFYEVFLKNMDSSRRQDLEALSFKRLLTNTELKSLKIDKVLVEKPNLQNKNYLLIHVSFAEYFVARWLSMNIENKEINTVINQCIERLILVTSSVFFFTVYNHLYSDKTNEIVTLLQTLIKNDFTNQLHEILWWKMLKPVEILDLLKDALKYKKSKSIKVILDYFKRHISDFTEVINSKSGSKIVINLAVESGNISTVCDCIAIGANVKNLKPELQRTILNFLFDEIFKGRGNKYIPIFEKFLQLKSNVILESLDANQKFPDLLNLILNQEKTQIAISLLQLLPDNDAEKQLLVVNANGKIKDEDRLELSKLLIKKFSANSKEHITSVLNAAINSKHKKCFEYFIDQYPQGSIGFFKDALLHNRPKALKFLLSSSSKFSNFNDTALFVAVGLSYVNPRMLKIILDQDSINKGNVSKANVLLRTAFKHNADQRLVRYLVEKQPEILNIIDTDGMLPWCYVLLNESRYSVQDQSDLIKFFQSKIKLKVPSNSSRSSFFLKRTQEIRRSLEFFENKSYDINYESEYDRSNSITRLHKAVQHNNVPWLKFLLAHGADPNIHESNFNQTPLHFAANLGYYTMVKHLLKHGAVFDFVDKNGNTPLRCTSHIVIQKLLERAKEYFYHKDTIVGLSTQNSEEICIGTCRNKLGRTLLHVAAEANDGKTVISLLKYYSSHYKIYSSDHPIMDINAKDYNGDTPLHIACRNGYLTLVDLLLRFGAIFEESNFKGETPRSLAQSSNRMRIINTFSLIQQCFKAIQENNHSVVKSSIEQCPSITNAKDINGMSPLHWITEKNDYELLKWFLIGNQRVYLPTLDLKGRTALHIAVNADNLSATKLLLQVGLSIDVKDYRGKNAMEYGSCNTKSAKMLRDIYKLFEDIYSDEPVILQDECPENLEKYLKKLEKCYGIESYVVLNTKLFGRSTLAHQAMHYNYNNVLENLFLHGAGLPRDLKSCAENTDSKKLVKKLMLVLKEANLESWLGSGFNEKMLVNFRGYNGETLLRKAVEKDRIEEIKWLLERGANPLDVDIKCVSPMSRAQEKCTAEIIDLMEKAVSNRCKKDLASEIQRSWN